MIFVMFDIDGTLLRTRGGSIRAMQRAAQEVFGHPGVFHLVECAGRLDPQIISDGLNPVGIRPSEEQWRRFKECYFAALREEVSHFHLVRGADRLVQALLGSGKALLGLATGNFTESAFIKIEGVGFRPEWFVANAFGEEVPDRASLVGLALQRAERILGFRPQRSIMVGDTPRDVAAAKANGCLAFAVAGGRFSVASLWDCGADFCAESLEPTPEALRFLLDGAVSQPRLF
jgi:phosphoglycolate phosphatase-like HAD superfamily hydrolase